jgi:hypothetical protein
MATKENTATPTVEKWVIKDRLYELTSERRPLVFTIPTKHSGKRPLLWFDEKTGAQRELRYATNQSSPFVDEQKGEATLGRIVMRNGLLRVPKEQQSLQKLLSLYHPFLNKFYAEYNAEKEAEQEVDWIELELEAMNAAKSMGIDQIEAVLRTEFGEKVDTLTTKELKRDALVFAKRNPQLFLELANDDDVELRNFGVKAVAAKIIKLSQDQRSFTYGESNRKLLAVPFDEHPFSALTAFFKTDEGMNVYKAIEKKMK